MSRSFHSSPPLPSIATRMAAVLLLLLGAGSASAQTCARTLTAKVVAFDQVWFWNRLGAVQPQGMMYALERDTISGPNGTRLRPDKRPRPLVLRMNVGDCLEIKFKNQLSPTRTDQDQAATRYASMHVVGLELVNTPAPPINNDASYVGQNPNGMIAPGGSITYRYYAEREGEHVIQSLGAVAGGEGDGGQVNNGLFGAVVVEPAGSRWYRSQVLRTDFNAVTTGTSQNGLPILDYDATTVLGVPILGMLQGNEIVRSDLTAVIVGSDPDVGGGSAGWFPPGTFPPNVYTYPQREQPFREFVIMYHDEIGAVQAFPEFYDPVLSHTLQGGRDAFAINYGTGGIGAEILANRFQVGPMHNCTECKFEEFFLSAWTVGDPAMVVDRPANSPCGPETTSPNTVGQDPNLPLFVSQRRSGTPCSPLPHAKATKAFFPDDPSNVYHGYLNDHTRFRVLHTGTKEHHIHHLHAHQWLYTADSDKSSYLDSQALGPGASFTAEIAYNGGGNLNRTPGDSIFHCHFYPHFAQGMWSLWRVHDVLELGTPLDAEGRPAASSRALPDGEIAAGTPIPGIIPLPGKPMPPLPTATVVIVGGQAQVTLSGSITSNPGYPFFVPGVAGHRPPHPPLDTIDDGGLPRHVITGGTYNEAHTRKDFHKTLLTAVAQAVPEGGTLVEGRAMTYHSFVHPTCLPDGTCGVDFQTNAHSAVRGAPYADPCAGRTPDRVYKAADIQDDVKINKVGWHFQQQRFTSLWEDVNAFLGIGVGTKKTPEPLFIRANSNECIEYQLTNLVPGEYKQDDFQVRTPTDILGQHIHLVKFDVLASDGAGNGFNYEDGTFSPDEVRERIAAIRAQNGCTAGDPRNNTFDCPLARAHPFFGAGPGGSWLGAQTTVQRWWADPVRDNNGDDRTLRTVFTHDHFGPSTHQQAGLYAGLVVEPAGSNWFHNESGAQLGVGRGDGGPTSWQAVIDPPSEPDYREFLLEFGDFQLAYHADSAACTATSCEDPAHSVNPPGRQEVGLPFLVQRPQQCPGGVAPPCPEIISSMDPGTMSVNYRNEPVALRVRNPATNAQAAGNAGDLSYAFSSNVIRSDAALNVQPAFYPALTADLKPKDPYTPLLRVYENDRVQIRVLVGAHEEGHNFNIHGVKWLFEPSEPDSGYRSSQMMGISEHFEFIVPQLVKKPSGEAVDRLWSAGSSTDDLWNGIWGLMRAYTGTRQGLMALPDNPNGQANVDPGTIGAFDFSCPKDAPVHTFDVTAINATNIPNGRITYNNRTDGSYGPLFDPTAIAYVRTSDIDTTTNQLFPTWTFRMEPLILRALAGECIKLTLRNALPTTTPLDVDGYNTLPMIVDNFNANQIRPSYEVGLHPQLLYYDVSRYDGANVGTNSVQTVSPGHFTTYEWYAGDVLINDATGAVTATPIEFGATNLLSSDRIEHASKGAIGALIIEPQDAFITEHPLRRSEAQVGGIAGQPDFREVVLVYQNDVNMRTESELPRVCNPTPPPTPATGMGWPVENLGCLEDAEDSGQKAVNYRTEPLWKRRQHPPGTNLATTDNFTDWWDVLSNAKVGGVDPQTPVYQMRAVEPVRFRVLMPGGHGRNIVFALHGHEWDKEPYVLGSTQIGHNAFSFWEGARMGHGPTNHFDALVRFSAGGKFGVTGDYLFRDQVGIGLDNGLWGILRVVP